jgi:hypothetical protein
MLRLMTGRFAGTGDSCIMTNGELGRITVQVATFLNDVIADRYIDSWYLNEYISTRAPKFTFSPVHRQTNSTGQHCNINHTRVFSGGRPKTFLSFAGAGSLRTL